MAPSIEVVIGDVHGRTDALFTLLREIGVIDSSGRRQRSGWVVQVGDLLDRRATPEANLETAQLAAEALDVVLAGNHEARLLADCDRDQGPALATLASHGWPQAAVASDGWLVTHAGVHPELARDLPADVADCANEINHRWHRDAKQRARDPLFASVGPARGGPDPYGGILWMHSDEWPKDQSTVWGQIAGHVPQPAPRLLPGPRWAIDIKAPDRLAALVRRQGDDRWRPVVVKARSHSQRGAYALAA
jgi:Calcineurin-like phosphoesterase